VAAGHPVTPTLAAANSMPIFSAMQNAVQHTYMTRLHMDKAAADLKLVEFTTQYYQQRIEESRVKQILVQKHIDAFDVLTKAKLDSYKSCLHRRYLKKPPQYILFIKYSTGFSY
jgi:hypothetical protein